MTKKTFIVAVLLFAGLAIPVKTQAHGTKTLFNPYVKQGHAEAEIKSLYVLDDETAEDSWGMELSAAYGVTSFWEVELGIVLEDEGRGEENEATALIFENKFQLAEPGTLFLDPGLKIEYARSLTGGADELGAKFLLAKSVNKFKAIANIGIAKEIGEDASDNAEYSLGYGVSYDVLSDLALGLEWHSNFENFDDDFDAQEHQIGPVAYGELFNVEYEAGVLVGASDAAPDVALKFSLGYEF